MTALTADFGESPLHRSSRVQKASEVTLQTTRIVSLEGLFERGHGAGMVALLPTPVRVWMTALARLAAQISRGRSIDLQEWRQWCSIGGDFRSSSSGIGNPHKSTSCGDAVGILGHEVGLRWRLRWSVSTCKQEPDHSISPKSSAWTSLSSSRASCMC